MERPLIIPVGPTSRVNLRVTQAGNGEGRRVYCEQRKDN